MALRLRAAGVALALALSGARPAWAADAAGAREQARRVLAQDRFQPPDDGSRPQPFKGLFERIGDWLDDLVDALDGSLPGGDWVVWTLLAVVLIGLVATLSLRVTRRLQVAETRAGAAGAGGGRGRRPDAGALEREAAEAERRGDHEAAVRLRYAAGLLRLDAAGRLGLRPSLTSGQARRALRSPRFDGLSRTFEAVTYGDRPAREQDAADAREGWAALLREEQPA